MHKFARYFYMLAGGLMMAACASDQDMETNSWNNDADAVRIAASVGLTTRTNPASNDEALQKTFNTGDRMEVSATSTLGDQKAIYQYTGTQWQPTGTDYLAWRKKAPEMVFQAFYPADGTNTYEHGHIAADQSTEEKISAADYMRCQTTYTERPADRMLKLNMVRQTARLVLRIKQFGSEFDANAKVKRVRIISNDIMTSTSAAPLSVSPLQNGDGAVSTTYTALVAPQVCKIEIYLTDNDSETPLTVNTNALTAATSYTYNLIVGKDKIVIDGVDVNNWNDGSTIDGGRAEEPNTDYVTFTANAEQSFTLKKNSNNYNVNGLEYSINNGNWKSLNCDEAITFGGINGTLRLRGISAEGTARGTGSYNTTITFGNATPVACSGDIRTLVDHRTKTPYTGNAHFNNLFENCTQLTSAPTLPATTLADYCYSYMFRGCTALQQAPELPATKLTKLCYVAMFERCENLTEAPELPATTLADYCYYNMFYQCTNLIQAPTLPADILQPNCYLAMFYGCTSLRTAPKLHATKLSERCYAYMFEECRKLSTIEILAPNDQITNTSYACLAWINMAGIDDSVTSRTLKVKDKAAYEALKATDLPTIWQISGGCNVIDENGNTITE